MSKGYQWLSQDPRNNTWSEYSAKDNDGIEQAYKKGTKYNLSVGGYDFVVDPKAMTQSSSRGSRAIKREDRKPKDPFAKGDVKASGDVKALTTSFQKYAGITSADIQGNPAVDYIAGSGLAALFEDLKIPTESVDAVIVCCMLQCSRPFTITKTEFIDGLCALGVTQIDQILKKLPEWKTKIKGDPAAVKAFFTFNFAFFRETETAPVITNETASSVLETLLPAYFPRFPRDKLNKYLVNTFKKNITKDIWRGIFEMLVAHPDGNFSTFDETSAWPGFVDDFVSAIKEGQL